jgi:chemotaxis signal transduction protein
LPVISLARRLDPTWMGKDESPLAVIIEALGRTAALVVDKIWTVIDARAEEVLPTPVQLDPAIAGFTLGVLRHDGLLAPIVDSSALLDYPQSQQDGEVRRTPPKIYGG